MIGPIVRIDLEGRAHKPPLSFFELLVIEIAPYE
jgi:hypothetical protein